MIKSALISTVSITAAIIVFISRHSMTQKTDICLVYHTIISSAQLLMLILLTHILQIANIKRLSG